MISKEPPTTADRSNFVQSRFDGKVEVPAFTADRSEGWEGVFGELIALLETEEVSDNGTVFRPNRISSCRVEDGARMNALLKRLKALATYKQKEGKDG